MQQANSEKVDISRQAKVYIASTRPIRDLLLPAQPVPAQLYAASTLLWRLCVPY